MPRHVVMGLSVTVAMAMIGLALSTAPALAAFPGQNGRIAYEVVQDRDAGIADIYSVNPDGSGVAQLTTDSGTDLWPAWSPDGQRLAFTSDRGGFGSQVWVMNADGTGQAALTSPPGQAASPAWSPDGQRIVFERAGDLWTMDADGTDPTRILDLPLPAGRPAWSPDGGRIAFSYSHPVYSSRSNIYTVRSDGTGMQLIAEAFNQFVSHLRAPTWSPDGGRIAYVHYTDNDGEPCESLYTIDADAADPTARTRVYPMGCDDPFTLADPAWSPDGTRIASGDSWRLFTIGLNGTGFSYVTTDSAYPYSADWQPLPVETLSPHARPKSATPFRVPLVPAAKPCTTPNRTHGPPLAFGSCNPVQPGSTHLTVGVGDGNPALSRSSGFVRLAVVVGVPGPPDDSDVEIRFSLTNVMRASDLSEYTGELRTALSVRRTDRDPPGAAPHSTTMDFPFAFTVPCAPTPGSSLDASTCDTLTSVNAVIPLAVEDTHRAIWALDALHVYDGGPDEDADTEGDNSLFMTQGVFVP